MQDQAVAERSSFAAALTRQIEGRNRAELVACIAERSGESMTVAALGHWLNGAVEPSRLKVIAAEECLGLRPGTLTSCFGYLPVAAKPVRTFRDVIEADARLDETGRAALLALYRVLAGG